MEGKTMKKTTKIILIFAVLAIITGICFILLPRAEKNFDSTCSLTVHCRELVENPEALPEEKRALVPPDGIIYENKNVAFSEGETVDDVLMRQLRSDKIHYEMAKIPGYDTTYVKGIANLYQMDAGDMSGWLFYVNGKSSDVGSSHYVLQQGDKVEWVYAIDFTHTEGE